MRKETARVQKHLDEAFEVIDLEDLE